MVKPTNPCKAEYMTFAATPGPPAVTEHVKGHDPTCRSPPPASAHCSCKASLALHLCPQDDGMESSRPRPGLRRSNTALPKLTTPGRSGTSTQSSKRAHLSLHHHHRHHKRHEHHSQNHHPSEDIKSAVLPGSRTSLGDLVRPGHGNKTAGGTPYSATPSHRNDNAASTEVLAGPRATHPHLVRPDDVVLERARAKKREEQLRKALERLSEYAMKATRRLDDTFYGILEKVSTLHSTIDGLQELSILTKSLHAELGSDADEVTEEIQGQIDGFSGFYAQRQLIEEFEQRIVTGREKAGVLYQRLEAARKQVDEREKAEGEWQATMSHRLRILWAVLGMFMTIFVVLIAVHNIKSHYDKDCGTRHANLSIDLAQIPVPAPVREILQRVQSTKSSVSWPSSYTALSDKDDTRLRLLDEL